MIFQNTMIQTLGGKIEYIPKRRGEAEITLADTEKSEKLLKWKAIHLLENYINKFKRELK